MVEKIVISACAAALFLMWLKMRQLKRDIYTFTEQLEQCLDEMSSGKDIGHFSEYKDSLWEKIYEKLWDLERIWQRQNRKNGEEKQRIKELISDISHQTKTPLANIKMYLEILEREEGSQEKREEFLEKLKRQTEKLDFLLQSMVKMSRLETGIIEIHVREANLFTTLAGALAAIVPKAEQKQISLYVECPERLIVWHDRKWTEEAVFNLLDNAVKYTEPGGKIHVTASKQEFFTKISVKDTGKGIAVDRQAQIFGRFYREPEVHDVEGVGVGLYLARKILTMQKGYIEVVSENGKGADFQMYLPNEEK